MLYAMLVACAALVFTLVLNISHAAKARHLRLFLAQQTWAELMDHLSATGALFGTVSAVAVPGWRKVHKVLGGDPAGVAKA